METELQYGPNPFTLEGQAVLAASGLKVRRSRGARKGAELAALYDKLGKAEADLSRAFNRWQKLRQQCARRSKQIDKEFAENATVE